MISRPSSSFSFIYQMASLDILQTSGPPAKETHTSQLTSLSSYSDGASESGDTLSTIESISPKPTGRQRRGTINQQQQPTIELKSTIYEDQDDNTIKDELDEQDSSGHDKQLCEEPDDTDWGK